MKGGHEAVPDSSQFLRLDCSDGRYKHLHVPEHAITGELDLTEAPFVNDHVIARPGVVLQLLTPETGESVLSEIRTMIQLKGIKTIRLFSHEDCGAYTLLRGGTPDQDQLAEDLRVAAGIIKVTFPNVCVKTHLVRLDGSEWQVDRTLVKL